MMTVMVVKKVKKNQWNPYILKRVTQVFFCLFVEIFIYAVLYAKTLHIY